MFARMSEAEAKPNVREDGEGREGVTAKTSHDDGDEEMLFLRPRVVK